MSHAGSGARGNLFAGLPAVADGESFEELVQRGRVRIERIVSSDRAEPTLYDQEQDEWVCLLQGEAELWVAGERVALRVGDHVLLPAHTPHRVLRTSASPRCIWLAVHMDAGR